MPGPTTTIDFDHLLRLRLVVARFGEMDGAMWWNTKGVLGRAQWQRRIVPALLDVMEALTGKHELSVQLITATHSPLVIVSMESRFDQKKDAIWELDLVSGSVQLRQSPWHRRGDANSWLTSSVFDLKEPCSIEAEEAISEALALLRADSPPKADLERVDGLLRAALSDVDRFWVRWSAFRRSFEGEG